ncbi:hypothetical protein B0T11DRAFT_356808 [Plectosphaerella cucumerina]|uniref:Uncharacterized protein n=1 Tax=Plectosphaerella cucumerina TaxID=40658 RepID=A0A8K0X030_9PEZI|nr:hypothetical protein B0T11DRAFT_356808 [Plectosphaerella cucumerina]
MNKSDLGNDTYVDADGKTQNPVATGTSDEAVMGVAKGLQMLCIKLPQLHRAAAVKAGLHVPGVALAAKVAEQDGDFFSDLSDIVQWIINVVEDVASIVFEAVDARPLWFHFDWSDFVAVKDVQVLKGAIKDGLKSFDGIQDRLQAFGDAWFKHARDDIMPRLTSMPMAKPRSDQTMQTAWSAAQPPPSPLGADNVGMRTDARLGWLKDRVSSPATSLSTGADKSTAINGSGPLAPPITAIETLILISGDTSAGDFFSAVLAAIELLGLDALQVVWDALLAAFKAVSSAIDAALEMPLQIPIVSWLYNVATGSDLTLLDATCLLLAIGVTLVYKIATKESLIEPLRQALTSDASSKVLGRFSGDFEPQSAGRESRSAFSTKNGAKGSVWGIIYSANRSAISNLAFIMDPSGRTARRIMELIDSGDEALVNRDHAAWEMAWGISIYSMAAQAMAFGGLGAPAVKMCSEMDVGASLGWRVWHFVHIFDVTSGGKDCSIGTTGEAITEALEVFQFVQGDIRKTLFFLAIRDMSTIIEAIPRFLPAVATPSESTEPWTNDK